MLHLVLGGARSGKSSFAEQWLLSQTEQVCSSPIYVATAQALDDEMLQRISHHQMLRENHNWQLVECPLQLANQIAEFTHHDHILVDCLTLWLSNQLMVAIEASDCNQTRADFLVQQTEQLVDSLTNAKATIVLVSNEVGLGVVPMGKESRLFVDHAGWLNQKVAQIATQVTLISAGLPLVLKPDAALTGQAND